jgi:phosphoenolpyruvate-protein kinase (PTS system EI component)
MAESAGTQFGRGELVAGKPTRGILVTVSSVEDVLALMKSDSLAETIVFAEQASVTNLAPVLSRIAGVISTAGGPTSHLAIVARGFETTCVVGAGIDLPVDQLQDKTVEIGADGSLELVAES